MSHVKHEIVVERGRRRGRPPGGTGRNPERDPPEVGARDWEPVTLSARGADGGIVGGLYGATAWGWLMIDGLWVDVEPRGEGLGSRLPLEAEALAVARGGRGAWLGTFDFSVWRAKPPG